MTEVIRTYKLMEKDIVEISIGKVGTEMERHKIESRS